MSEFTCRHLAIVPFWCYRNCFFFPRQMMQKLRFNSGRKCVCTRPECLHVHVHVCTNSSPLHTPSKPFLSYPYTCISVSKWVLVESHGNEFFLHVQCSVKLIRTQFEKLRLSNLEMTYTNVHMNISQGRGLWWPLTCNALTHVHLHMYILTSNVPVQIYLENYIFWRNASLINIFRISSLPSIANLLCVSNIPKVEI